MHIPMDVATISMFRGMLCPHSYLGSSQGCLYPHRIRGLQDGCTTLRRENGVGFRTDSAVKQLYGRIAATRRRSAHIWHHESIFTKIHCQRIAIGPLAWVWHVGNMTRPSQVNVTIPSIRNTLSSTEGKRGSVSVNLFVHGV